MIRVLNFFCVAATAVTCIALNHVSDQTRVAEAQLHRTRNEIVLASDALKILDADWERASNPAHIQVLAATHLGLADAAAVELASLDLLPRRGESAATESAVSNAGAVLPAVNPHLRLVAARAGD